MRLKPLPVGSEAWDKPTRDVGTAVDHIREKIVRMEKRLHTIRCQSYRDIKVRVLAPGPQAVEGLEGQEEEEGREVISQPSDPGLEREGQDRGTDKKRNNGDLTKRGRKTKVMAPDGLETMKLVE